MKKERALMRRKGLLLSFLCLMVLEVGCGGINVKYDYDPMADFRAYRRFNWMPTPNDPNLKNAVQVNTLSDRRIKQAVNVELLKKGFQLVDDNIDMLVAYHLGVGGPVNTNAYGYASADYLARGYGQGTLILDLVDATTHELIWRAAVSGAVDSDPTPEEIQKTINGIISKMFENYPPQRK